MTTEITKSLSPRLPRPDAYKAFLDRLLPDRLPLRLRVLAFLQKLLRRLADF